MFNLVRFNGTVNTNGNFDANGVQKDVLSRDHKTQSAILVRLLAQTIKAAQKRNRAVRVTNIQKDKYRYVKFSTLKLDNRYLI